MKKILTLALCAAAVLTAGAQKPVVDQAKKLAGKTDKLTEARGLIQEAIQNPETANQAETYYVAGKIEWDAYDRDDQVGAVDPSKVNVVDQVGELLNGYNYYLQMFPLDQLPNEKGQVKPKYTNEVRKKIASKYIDFAQAGQIMYQMKEFYPLAYETFMIAGDIPGAEFMGKDAPAVPDTIRAINYFNAGLCAWTANQLDAGAEAFRKARLTNYPDANANIYEIACWQYIEQNDSTRVDEAKKNIYDAAKAGYNVYGLSNPFFINNIVNVLLTSGQGDAALAEINQAMAQNPDNSILYGLSGWANEYLDNDDASVADYIKAANLIEQEMASGDAQINPDSDLFRFNYDNLRNAIRKIFRVGQAKWNEIDLGDPESRQKKADIRANYFELAKKYATMADQLKPGDSDIQYLMDAIDYQLSL